MTKKSFAQGIDAFFGKTDSEIEEPKKLKEIPKKKTEQRATFILNVDQLEIIKAMAYWERKTAKLVLKEAIDQFISMKGENQIRQAINHYRSNNSI